MLRVNVVCGPMMTMMMMIIAFLLAIGAAGSEGQTIEDIDKELHKAASIAFPPIVADAIVAELNINCSEKFCPNFDYGPQSASFPCHFLPLDFIDCDELVDHQDNKTAFEAAGIGCLRIGNQNGADMHFGSRICRPLGEIECYGNRTFAREGFACVRQNGHYFVTTLLFSILLGFLGMDRFYLGHAGTATGKMLTIGGFGIWWIVDIILLVTGHLVPEDGSNWVTIA